MVVEEQTEEKGKTTERRRKSQEGYPTRSESGSDSRS